MFSKMHVSPPSGLGYCQVLFECSVVVDSLFIFAPIVCGGSVFGACLVN